MLVLTRKKDQTIVINNDIEITVLDIQGDQVRIGINAPRSVSIHRKEVFLEIQRENEEAARIKPETDKISLDEIIKMNMK
jgi:carbon storage regulator